jgi:NAD(P)-dependent dehydrogenase (short-subunit alcohol dehydrogenase family)
MQLDLEGKRALVTGSSSGIGEGVAEMLAAEGATVAIHGRDAARTQATAQRIESAGGSAHVVLGELDHAAGCEQVAAAVLAQLGGLDILVNNAGGVEYPDGRRYAVIGGKQSPVDSWFEMAWTDWLANYEQNVGSTVRLIHAFVPGMIEQGWGRIINTASVAASTGLAEIPNYGASKAAITNLTVSLSRALTGTGITVNTITPGIIRTPVVDGWFAAMGEQYGWGPEFEDIEPHMAKLFDTAVRTVGRPSDIAAMVCLLCSPHGGYITGANMRIEGGFSRHPN